MLCGASWWYDFTRFDCDVRYTEGCLHLAHTNIDGLINLHSATFFIQGLGTRGRNSAGRRAGSPGAAGLAAGWSAEWRTLLVQGGRRDKLRPGDILGALTSSGSGSGLSGADVGTIEVTDQRTWVAVRSAAAAEAAAALGKTRIKKSKFKVYLVDET